MPIHFREPKKRGRTLYAIPYLWAYKREDEKLDQLRLGLDPRSHELLHRLAKADNLADSTWFSMLAHRLLTDPELVPAMQRFADREYRMPPGPHHYAFKLYTIPQTLKEAIEQASETFPSIFEGKSRLISKWVRMALVYCATREKEWVLEQEEAEVVQPIPADDSQTTEELLKTALRQAQQKKMTRVPFPVPHGLLNDLQRIAPKLKAADCEELIRSFICRGLREEILRLELSGS